MVKSRFFVVFLFLVACAQSLPVFAFINVAGSWVEQVGDPQYYTLTRLGVSQDSNGKILEVSGFMYHYMGNYGWGPSWERANTNWVISCASASFSWNTSVTVKSGSWVDHFGPFLFNGNAFFSAQSEQSAQYGVDCGLNGWGTLTTRSGTVTRESWAPLVQVTPEITVSSVSAVPAQLSVRPGDPAKPVQISVTTSAETDVTVSVMNASGTPVFSSGLHTSGTGGAVGTTVWSVDGSTLPGTYRIVAVAGSDSKETTVTVETIAEPAGPPPASLTIAAVGPSDYPGPDKQPPLPQEPRPVNCPPSFDRMSANLLHSPSAFPVADPVNIPSGNFTLVETDLTLKSRLPLTLARVYNSIDTYSSPFGRGWNSPYVSRLEVASDTGVFINADGSRVIFNRQGDVFTPTAGVQLTLTLATDTGYFSVSHPEGSSWIFDSDGKILRMIKACCGRGAADSVNFEYDDNGGLKRVSNPAGQWLDFTPNDTGLITGVTDSSGRTLSYDYDEAGNLTTYTDAAGRVTRYTYDDKGFMTCQEQPGNRIRTITYTDGRVSSVTTPNGEHTTFTWEMDVYRVSLVDPSSVNHSYQFAPDWNLISYATSAPGMNTISRSYTASGFQLASYTDGLNGAYSYSYTSTGLLQSMSDPLGNTSTYDWDNITCKLTKKTDALGREWRYNWCPRGNLWSEVDPAGGVTSYTYDAYNNKTSKTDQLGRKTKYVYSSNGSYLISTIDANGSISSFTYDARGNLTSAADPLIRTTTFSYDLLDRLTKTIYPDGRTIDLEYDEAGNVAVRRDNLGRETRYVYDLSNRLIKLVRPDQTEVQYTYNADGKKTSETDPLGRITRFEYTPLGWLSKTIYPDSSEESFSYDAEGHLIGKTNELGQTTNFECDPLGRLLATNDPTGARWESTYDAAGRKTAEKDPLGSVTIYQLNSLDKVVQVARPDNSFVTNTYDAVGNLLSSVDALGSRWVWVYDSLNRQVKAVQPNGASSTTAFDAAGQIIAETDALGRATTYSFDNGGRKVTTIDALGNVWQNMYDNAGRLLATKDPMGGVSSLTHDLMDRVVSQSDALGNVTLFELDDAGRRVARTDAEGRRSITVYDLRNHVTSEVDPEGHTVAYAYNAAGQRVSLTDGSGRVWRWEHDSLGRVTAEIDPLGNTNRYVFDAVGNRIAATNARNQTTAYTFDSMNRLTQVTNPDGALATMVYDLEGRELSRSGSAGSVMKTWDSVGNLTSETFGPWGKKWQYSFDVVGNRVQAIDPDGQVFKYAFDMLNRMVLLDPSGQGDEVKTTFDAFGRPIVEERPGVKTTSSYNAAGQLLALKHEPLHGSAKTVALRRYTYSPVGNRMAMTDEDGGVTRYSYNGSDWLTKAVYPDGQQVSYTYNDAGDRIEEKTETPIVKKVGRNIVVSTATVVLPLAYDAGGRLIAKASDTFAFDADGNQVSAIENGDVIRYLWSSDNRLLKVEKDIECQRHSRKHCRQCPQTITLSESYGYLPNDWRRISRTAGDEQFVSVYDGDDESHEYLVKEKKHFFGWRCLKHFRCSCPAPKSEKKLDLLRQFIGGPGTDDLVATKYNNHSLWRLTDALGSTIALTNRGGHPVAKIGYDAFGNLRFPDKPGHSLKPCDDKDVPDWLDRFENGRSFGGGIDPWHFGRHHHKTLTPYLYTGRRFDQFAGQYFNRNRYYSPKVGRFTSRDPIGFTGGNNQFAYASLNPTRYMDPHGESIEDAINTIPPQWVDRLEKANKEKDYAEVDRVIQALLRDKGKWNCKIIDVTVSEIYSDPGYKAYKGQEGSKPKPPKMPSEPSQSPGPGWEWRGKGPPGSDRGGWFNPKTGETMHPNLDHLPPVGPHWDYRAPDGRFWRIFQDGRVLPRN